MFYNNAAGPLLSLLVKLAATFRISTHFVTRPGGSYASTNIGVHQLF